MEGRRPMTNTPAITPLISTPVVGATALVTGAAGGMGRAISAALLASGVTTVYGFDRVAVDQDGVTSAIVDLSDLDAVAAAIVALVETPQIVVNAAGYYSWREGFDITADDFRRTLDINVSAPFVIMREVAARL